MFGALLSRVPNPFALMDDFHLIYLIIMVWSAVAGVLGVIAGISLLTNQSFSRSVALIAAFVSLCELPLGLTLGTYTLIVLLPSDRFRSQAV